MTINPVAFKSVYKVTLPNVKEAQNEQEKNAFTDTAINTIMMGANNSIAQPRISADQKSVYFKLDNKNDADFEITEDLTSDDVLTDLDDLGLDDDSSSQEEEQESYTAENFDFDTEVEKASEEYEIYNKKQIIVSDFDKVIKKMSSKKMKGI